jgi:hypothetical protein
MQPVIGGFEFKKSSSGDGNPTCPKFMLFYTWILIIDHSSLVSVLNATIS